MARIIVLGASGTGKSYYAGKLLEEIVPEFDLAIHFDLEDEEMGLSDADRDPIYQSLYVDVDDAIRLDWLKVVANHRKIRVIPFDMTKAEMQQLYAHLCDCVMSICKDGYPDWTAFVSCDEAHNLVTQAAFDDRVERMITGGRKHGVECLHISQRPQLLHTTVISQADRRIYFSIGGENDIKKIEKVSSFDAGQVLDQLPDRVCVVENKSTGDWIVLVTDPAAEQHVTADILVDNLDVDETEREHRHYSGDDGIADDFLPV